MSNIEGSTRVEVFDQSYLIRGVDNDEYIKGLAAYVDRKMREIADVCKTVDGQKVAVLAALNIADELFQEKENTRKLDSVIFDRSAQCSRMLDQVLRR
ncbi:MAG: cell division protein ZapA [Terriglobia bacterium]